MSAPANKIKIQKSNSAEAQPVLFGLMSRVRKNNKWSFRVNWGRLAILIAVLALLAWTAVSATIYFVFKYSKGFDDMTVYDAAVAPFDMRAHREKVGNYKIEKALNILKSGKMSDFNEAFMNLAMGINRAPKNVEGRLQLSRIYVAMGRPDIAIEKLEQGIMHSKDNLDFIRLYMRLLLDRMEDTKIIASREERASRSKIRRCARISRCRCPQSTPCTAIIRSPRNTSKNTGSKSRCPAYCAYRKTSGKWATATRP